MKEERCTVADIDDFGSMMKYLFFAVFGSFIICLIGLAVFLHFAGDTLSEDAKNATLYVVFAIVAIVFAITYTININEMFGEKIDLIYNWLFLIISAALGAGIGFLVYPNFFQIELPDNMFSVEGAVWIIYFLAPVLAIIISLLAHWIYAFCFYCRTKRDWILMPLFVILMLGLFTLALYICNLLVIAAAYVIGIIAFVVMLPSLVGGIILIGMLRE